MRAAFGPRGPRVGHGPCCRVGRLLVVLALVGGACTPPTARGDAHVGVAAQATVRAAQRPNDGLPGRPRTARGPEPIAVHIDAAHPGPRVSELIRGVSGDVAAADMADAGLTLNSWGGNPATRYNYRIGNAWNAGVDWSFRNGNYGTTGDVAARFLTETAAAGAAARLAVPTLGWVARDDNPATCSFPAPDGSCPDVTGLDCSAPTTVADPRRANVTSSPETVSAWIQELTAREGHDVAFIAMDNEPELWGVTHYDVHPSCTTYEEILDSYLTYATVLRDVAPDAKLMGPVMCCWYDFWQSAPGPADGPYEDFLPWFLKHVRVHDEGVDRRTLDVLDVHYYPQSDVYNDRVDDETAARRLRSTRALWDPEYVDESWIDQPIGLIPRLLGVIEATYPGTPLAITEWNFGADTTMNGALAIADVLGIYGREGVHAAAYWRSPPVGSPGWFAFKMHGNYDDAGSSFAGRSLRVQTADADTLSAFATLDTSPARLQVLLLNKNSREDVQVDLLLEGWDGVTTADVHRYDAERADRIVHDRVDVATEGSVVLPAYSITLIEIPSQDEQAGEVDA